MANVTFPGFNEVPPSAGKTCTASDIAKANPVGFKTNNEVRKPLLSELEDNLREAKDRTVMIYDLVDSLESAMFGIGGCGVKGESLTEPAPARSLENLVKKSGDHTASLASLVIRLENLICRL
nr:MAG: hypothetical protein [Bacteriophage sp.]